MIFWMEFIGKSGIMMVTRTGELKCLAAPIRLNLLTKRKAPKVRRELYGTNDIVGPFAITN